MFGLTWWQELAAMLLIWGVVQLALLVLWWWHVSHRQRDEVERVDDVSGLHVFDDEDFF